MLHVLTLTFKVFFHVLLLSLKNYFAPKRQSVLSVLPFSHQCHGSIKDNFVICS